MENNELNATCSICGTKYHVCNSCLEQKTFKPWRTVTDSIEHYKIYIAVHSFSITKNRDTAKKELQNCDLSNLKNFLPAIQNVINEILKEDKIKNKNLKSDSKIGNTDLQEIKNGISNDKTIHE